ncbi:MAG: HAD hydrolase family protein [Elusimicrobiota bacterium]|jgi:3-deoxy-D-manno-octulosonate 8-phosphate phosphatase (KDO 8-P phosphatase)
MPHKARLDLAGFNKRARRIKLVLMDVDGVLTSGVLWHFVDTSGALVELKGIHAQDSIALTWLADAGIRTGIISGRVSAGVAERAKALRMSYIYQHRLDKRTVFEEIRRDAGVEPEETLFMGDDIQDLPVMRCVGLSVAPPNARPEVRAASRWVTRARGGDGAVREVAELLLRAQGRWKDVLAKFS